MNASRKEPSIRVALVLLTVLVLVASWVQGTTPDQLNTLLWWAFLAVAAGLSLGVLAVVVIAVVAVAGYLLAQAVELEGEEPRR